MKLGVDTSIVTAKHLGGYRLQLTFSDRHVSVVDFRPFLSASLNPETRRFLNAQRFRQFAVKYGNVVWGDYTMCFPIEDLYSGNIGIAESVVRQLAVAEEKAEYRSAKHRKRQ